MSFFFAREKRTIPHIISGITIQSAVGVLPIPIIYGSPRVAMNIIYINGFRHITSSASSGGKGALTGGKGTGNSQVTYYATFIGALGEGEINTIIEVFDNQSTYTFGGAPEGRSMSLFVGTPDQSVWAYVYDHWPEDSFNYKDTAYIGFGDYKLDSSGTLPQLNFLVSGILAETSPLNPFTDVEGGSWFLDADPARVVPDMLTHSRYGAGFPDEFIDYSTLTTSANGYIAGVGDAALSTYCQAAGLAWSVVLSSLEPASSILERWMKNLVVAVVWTGSILKFVPYWASYADANPGWEVAGGIDRKYYQPNITPLFDLTDRDFLRPTDGDDPLVLTVVDIANVKNVVRMNYRDRYNEFNDVPAEAKDEDLVELYGQRVQQLGSSDEFTRVQYATVAAEMTLWRNVTNTHTFQFRLGPQFCCLDPMDIVTLTDSTLGLAQYPVRIQSITEDEKGELTVIAENFPAAVTSTVWPAAQTTSPAVPTNEPAPAVNFPVLFEPPTAFLQLRGLPQVPSIVAGVSGGPNGSYSANWGGCNIHASVDGITYDYQGTVYGPMRTGTLMAVLPTYGGANPDTTNTLDVSVSESNSVLQSGSAMEAMMGLTLCAVVDPGGSYELISYTTATLTAPGRYDLDGLYRGFAGTAICEHPVGSKFLFLDSSIFVKGLPNNFIGVAIYLKFQSFNLFRQGLQDLADCEVYTVTPWNAGATISDNPIWATLSGGGTVDENTAVGSLDLMAGGIGDCASDLGTVDLGTIP